MILSKIIFSLFLINYQDTFSDKALAQSPESGCPTGSSGWRCFECAPEYIKDLGRDPLDAKCKKCSSQTMAIVLVCIYILLVSLLCTFLAILNVYAGFNRRTIHSIVIKIFLTYSATLMTVEGSIKQALKGTRIQNFLNNLLAFTTGFQSLEFYPFECILFRDEETPYYRRFFAANTMFCLLPLLCIGTSTLLSGAFYLIARPFFLEKVRKRYRFVVMLRDAGLGDIADRVTKELESFRIVSIWRYAEFGESLSFGKRFNRFLKDMVRRPAELS
eukprot:Gregarina_sp_Poly_1__8804@NODE_528_length_7666_cov_26_468351_g418_i0_p2_GENE_NODE_528_length_7666_cov_26_468351_g418_i0NODE_528_length_7666_cov_26_468351_g418_i0_p2_ORF_typecomplete_len274_score26_827tm_7/PF08395_12/0_055Claudin_3/PF06653_11/0_029Claudin_3/PF06653_11/4e02InaFmotif/PF15018_6/0_57MCLC/PF05934_11/1_2_NODE_528_length_7666_cov_26_468351_g418_i029303751